MIGGSATRGDTINQLGGKHKRRGKGSRCGVATSRTEGVLESGSWRLEVGGWRLPCLEVLNVDIAKAQSGRSQTLGSRDCQQV